MHVETFSTTHIVGADRNTAWQREMQRLSLVNFATEPVGHRPFSAELKRYCGGRLKFSSMRFTPHVSTSRPGEPHHRARSHYVLAYLHAGAAMVAQDGRETSVQGGDIVLIDPTRSLQIRAASMQVTAFDLCAEQFKLVFPQVTGVTAIALKERAGCAAILKRMLDEIVHFADVLNDETSDRIADALPHLTAAAFASLPSAHIIQPNRLEAYHRERIRRCVRDNLQNPKLSPEMVAETVGLSPRHIHELFGDGSTTLMRWVWESRLAQCREELAMPELRKRSVSEIAYDWGFTSSAHFSRRFKAAFGLAPVEYRKQALAARP